jgi:hypothetical protein
VAVSAGVATFNTLSINLVGTGYTLTASSGTLTGATSGTFNITPGPATQLDFDQGPTSATAGVAITPAVTVAIEDANGNVETADNTDTVGLAIGTNPASGTLTGGSAVAVSAGVATFSGLSVNKAGTGYTLTASSGTLTSATSGTFNITPGAPSQIVFDQGPTSATAGAAITPAVTVAIEDANGNVETADNTDTVSLAIGTNPGSGTLTGGSAVAVSGGIATFSGLLINKVGTGYTLAASSGTLSSATSGSFNITPGTPSQIVFLQGPSNTQAGASISPAVTVALEDANGNVETADNTDTVGLAIGTNAGTGTLSGGVAVAVSSGVAAFNTLSINKVGTGYTLVASSGTLAAVTSATFNITIGPPTQVAFIQAPTNTLAGTGMSPAVTVAVEDAAGNVETADNTDTVDLAIGTNVGGGTLGGGSATAVSAGVATFAGLSINAVGNGYTLAATSGTLTSAISSPFNITGGELGLSCALLYTTPPTQCQGIDLPAITLSGSAQTVVAPANSFYVTDQRGLLNVGWSVSAYLMPTASNPNTTCVNVTTFCNASVGSAAANPQGQIPASDFSVGSLTCAPVSGNSNPNAQSGPGGSFPGGSGAVSLCSASAGQSAGTFRVGATYSLAIPRGVYAGKYQATVEYLAF